MLIDFREEGRKGEKEREKHWCERETSIRCLSYAPVPDQDRTRNLDMHPDLNQTLDLSVHSTVLQPTEPHWPGLSLYISIFFSVKLFL